MDMKRKFFAAALLLAMTLQGAAAQAVIGQGPGYHDPRSPFAPLQEKEGILTWELLSSVTTKAEKTKLTPVFPAKVLALDKRKVKVQGFMMPLEPGEKQKHFLLTSVPLTCSFCIPGGPESMVEVFTKTAIKYTLQPVVVEGRFDILVDDPHGLYYRMTDAASVK